MKNILIVLVLFFTTSVVLAQSTNSVPVPLTEEELAQKELELKKLKLEALKVDAQIKVVETKGTTDQKNAELELAKVEAQIKIVAAKTETDIKRAQLELAKIVSEIALLNPKVTPLQQKGEELAIKSIEARIADLDAKNKVSPVQVAKQETALLQERLRQAELQSKIDQVSGSSTNLSELDLIKQQTELAKAQLALEKVEVERHRIATPDPLQEETEFWRKRAQAMQNEAQYEQARFQRNQNARRALEADIQGFFIESQPRRFSVPNTPFRASVRTGRYGFTASGRFDVNAQNNR